MHAGRIGAVLAADRDEGAIYVRKRTGLDINHCTAGEVALACRQAAVQV
jgi:hypothetical protein